MSRHDHQRATWLRRLWLRPALSHSGISPDVWRAEFQGQARPEPPSAGFGTSPTHASPVAFPLNLPRKRAKILLAITNVVPTNNMEVSHVGTFSSCQTRPRLLPEMFVACAGRSVA